MPYKLVEGEIRFFIAQRGWLVPGETGTLRGLSLTIRTHFLILVIVLLILTRAGLHSFDSEESMR
jgi:hypothetical protein